MMDSAARVDCFEPKRVTLVAGGGEQRSVACQMLAGSLAADQGAIRDHDLTANQRGQDRDAGYPG